MRMAQSPVQPAPFDKVIKTISAVSSNRGLLGLGMLLLFLSFIFTLFGGTGVGRWFLSAISLGGLIGINVPILIMEYKRKSEPAIPYDPEYLMELLRQGRFYGDEDKLISLNDSDESDGL